MAYTALHRLPGIALVVSQGTTTPVAIAAFEDISIDVELDVADATAANAAFEQLVATRKKGNGSLTGFIGADFPLLNVGDAFAVLSPKAPTPCPARWHKRALSPENAA